MTSKIQQVLIVDDLVHCREWMRAAVADAFKGVVIVEADTVQLALSHASTHGFELAVIDLGLPDGSGLEVIAALAQFSPTTLSVVSTMFDDDAHLFPALQTGAAGYLLKDHSRTQIAELLKGILIGQPPLSPSIARRVLKHFSRSDSLSNPTASIDNANHASASPTSVESNQHLSPRETDVLQLIAKGYSVPRVAEYLTLSKNTVAGYLKDIYRKLAVNSRAEATLEATRRGLVRA